MLSAAGENTDSTVSGSAAISLMNTAALLALPLLALPAMLAWIVVSPGLRTLALSALPVSCCWHPLMW